MKNNKTNTYNEVVKLMVEFEEQFKSKKQFDLFKSEIDKLLAPKSGGGVVQNPSIEQDGVTYHYCRYTGYYIPESDMVMSSGKSKGYSKKAIAKWTKAGKEAQLLNEQAMKLLLSGETVEGTNKASEAEELKLLRNKVEYYDDVRLELDDIKLAQ